MLQRQGDAAGAAAGAAAACSIMLHCCCYFWDEPFIVAGSALSSIALISVSAATGRERASG